MICIILEVVKSNTNILPTDCNNNLDTKETKKVLNIIICENKGGRLPSGGKLAFSDDRDLWPMESREVPKSGRVKKIGWCGRDLQRFFVLYHKQKSYVTFKVGHFDMVASFWNKRWCKEHLYLGWIKIQSCTYHAEKKMFFLN